MKKILSVILALIMLLTVAGCGSQVDETLMDTSLNPNDYEPGQYYIYNMQTKKIMPTYFNEASFKQGQTTDSPSNSRVVWFRNDFNQIPVLNPGDRLIYYTNEPVSGSFEANFEKFEYLGITVPFKGLKSKSDGTRFYTLSTQEADGNLYPGSEADKFMNLTNTEITVHSVGGINLSDSDVQGVEKGAFSESDRMDKDNDHKSILTSKNHNKVTRVGTVNLAGQTGVVEVEIYDGTVGHVYKMPIDTYVLASSQVVKQVEYDYWKNIFLEIPLPENLVSGYYLVNGVGMFIYNDGVNGINDNVLIELTEKDKQDQSEENQNPAPQVAENETINKMTIKEVGKYEIIVSFDDTTATNVSVMLTDAEGYQYSFNNMYDGTYNLTFMPQVPGECTISYYNLKGRTPHISVNEIVDE